MWEGSPAQGYITNNCQWYIAIYYLTAFFIFDITSQVTCLDATVILTICASRSDSQAGELELASIFMLKNENKLQNAEACLHFLVSKCPLTRVVNQSR